MRWGIPLAVFALVLLVLSLREGRRFDRGVAAIENEPGLVVIHADRRWGTWRISGLRDPLARTPAVVLAGLHLTPRALVGRWEPYLSLDSGVVVARARQSWGLSDSTQLTLRGDSLTIGGLVPLFSLSAMRQGVLPGGVATMDVGSASILLPSHLDSLRQSLEDIRVLFEPGERQAYGAERTRLAQVAAQFKELSDSIEAHDADATITMVGRTDPTGTNETNQALAQWRVDHVSAIFASAGVRPGQLRGQAVATSRPLTAADSITQARINRSVSFEIGLVPRPRAPRGQ